MSDLANLDRTRRIKDILWILAYFGVVAMVLRFVFGLGETTNLSDRVPWGLWKILNMIGGAALATSGFTVGFLGHVLHIKKFEKLVKPAVLVAFLGYGSSLFALLFDIGLPWRFWHPFVHWNIHSFLFEVFWCVSIYFCITFLELSPVLLERIGLAKLRGKLHKAAGVFVIIGITLSSMHHTSLGSLFLVTPVRLHSLWYSPIISLLFIVSAIGGGMLLLALVKILYAWWYDRDTIFSSHREKSNAIECKACDAGKDENESEEASDLASVRALLSVGSGVLGFYLLLKLGDLFLRPEAIAALTAGTWESSLYSFELLTAIFIPIVMIWTPSVRKSPVALAVASAFGVFGLALNRMNVGIFGYFRDATELYFPSAIEWAITLGVLAMAGLAFFFIVEHFSVFDENWKLRGSKELKITSAFDRLTYVWNHRMMTGLERNTIIAVVVLPLAFLLLYPPYMSKENLEVNPPMAVDVTRDTLRLDGNRSGVTAVFAHTAHQERLGGETSCAECHHLALPQDQATSCRHCHKYMEEDAKIFDHNRHARYVADTEGFTGWHPENQSCNVCHGAYTAKTGVNSKGCLECHNEDMKPINPPAGKLAQLDAPSYHRALHESCINCHIEKAVELNHPELGDCNTCHVEDILRPEQLVSTRKNYSPLRAKAK